MRSVPRSIVITYSIGSLGTGMFLSVPSVLLLFYLTEVVAVAPLLAGLAVFLPRIWDVVTDPAMGWISDRTRSRLGRRRPWLLAGSILTGISLVLLFNAPTWAQGAAGFFYVLLIYVISATAYTLFAVPYLSMPAEMSEAAEERTRIMAWRMGFAMVGILIGSALAPWLIELFGGGRAGFAGMAWVLGPLCGLVMLIAFLGTARAPVIDSARAGNTPGGGFLDALRNRPFRLLALAYILQLGGLGTFTAAAPYFVTYTVGRDEGAIALMFVALIGGTLVSMAGWYLLARHIGKPRAYVLAATLAAVGLAGLFLVSASGAWTMVLILTLVVGMGFGGLQLLPFAILTDVIHIARSGGRDLAGILTGVWTAVEKSALAVGPAIVGILLAGGGFISGLDAQSETATLAVRAGLAGLPAVLVLASVPVLLHQHRIQRELAYPGR